MVRASTFQKYGLRAELGQGQGGYGHLTKQSREVSLEHVAPNTMRAALTPMLDGEYHLRDSSKWPVGESVADAVPQSAAYSVSRRILIIGGAAAAGVGTAMLAPVTEGGLIPLFCVLAFLGGLLSTWSPCGYSSLSLLRIDPPHNSSAVARWLPTMTMHALGYATGGAILVLLFTPIHWLLPINGFSSLSVAGLAIVALLYGLHQLKIVVMPYPQLRLQVSHGARMDLPKWITGFVYGCHLGLNFATYVRTPILYLLALACVLSGNVLATAAIIVGLNVGRFLPLLVNLLPLPDSAVQRWLASNGRAAVAIDGSILVFVGAVLMAVSVSSLS